MEPSQAHNVHSARRDAQPEPLWTLEEVAAYLRVSRATVRRWTNAGLLPCFRLGGNRERRFSQQAVLAFLTQRRETTQTQPV